MANVKLASTRNLTVGSAIVLIVAITIYLLVGVADLGLPGLQYDEAADAVPAMELLTGQPISSLSTLTVLGRQLPLMMLHHIGPTTILTSFVGMAILGINVQALRISQLMVGVITLFLLWLLSRRWFGDITAAIAVLLCATAPAFIWWNRAGANWTAPLLPITIGMLLLLERWWRSRKSLYLVGAAFLFGAGFTTKILFIWWLAPIAITLFIVVGFRRGLAVLRSLRPAILLLAMVALLAGLGPFILHNVISPFATFNFLASNALTTSIYGHNNFDFFNNLRQVFSEFMMMLGGDTLAFHAPTGSIFGSILFAASMLIELGCCIHYRNLLPINSAITNNTLGIPRQIRLRLFLVVTFVTIIPLSTVSTSTIGATYLFIVVPFAWLLISVAIRDTFVFARRLFSNPLVKLSGAMLVIGLAIAQVGMNVVIIQFFKATGGQSTWSDAIFAVAKDLQTNYISRPIIAMDWGYARNVTFLTQGKVHMREVFEFLPQPSPGFREVSLALLQDPANVYVFHAPDATVFQGYFPAFDRVTRQTHKSLHLINTFLERTGASNTLIYEAGDLPRSFDVSPTLSTRNATFADGLTLLGGTVAYDSAKREVAVEVQWQSTIDKQPDDTVLLHIVDESNGNVVANGDQRPVYGYYPFPSWQKNEVVIDPHWITLPAGLKPGIYQVRIGVYDRNTGIRREIHDPQNDAAGNSLMLHSFEVR